jgi:hypothetical protein
MVYLLLFPIAWPNPLAGLLLSYGRMLHNPAVAFSDLFRTTFPWLALQPLRVLTYLSAFQLVHLCNLLCRTDIISRIIPL